MAVIHGRLLTFDEEELHVGRYFEWITVGDDDVCEFSGFECADLIGDAKNLGWINRDGFQGLVIGQAVGNGVRGLLPEAAREGIVKAADREFHAGCGEFRGLREETIVRVVFINGQG